MMSLLLQMPAELLLLIDLELPAASQASLSLTCKALYSLYTAKSTPFTGVKLPVEQPEGFTSNQMSRPEFYQPERWQFLLFLQADLKEQWLLCSECFTLHPKHMFLAYERSLPGLQYDCKFKTPEIRTCRHGRTNCILEREIALAPSGVVDLCPCIKLTIAKKREIEARLHEIAMLAYGQPHPVAHMGWHVCQHTYGDLRVELRISLYLNDASRTLDIASSIPPSTRNFPPLPYGADRLRVRIDYRHTVAPGAGFEAGDCPRMLCPHQNVEKNFYRLMRFFRLHDPKTKFQGQCKHIHHCSYCPSRVHSLRDVEWHSDGSMSSTYTIDRCLDDSSWPMQTVFPYARRQLALDT